MKRNIRARWIFATALLAALLAAPAPAQDGGQDGGQDQGQDAEPPAAPQQEGSGAAPEAPGTAQEPSGRAQQAPNNTGELVIQYLQQDIFLRPGVGLKSVKLGMPFEAVLQAWGEPASRDSGSWTDTKLIYRAGNHTRIILSGDDSVESMRVQGGLGSPYTTTEGVSFGMAQHHLATFYGAKQARSGKVTYSKRGIGFGFTQGRVSEIRIFYPD